METLQSQTMQSIIWICFLGAILHALFAHYFLRKAQEYKAIGLEKTFLYNLCDLAGHATFVFTLWLIPPCVLLFYYGGAAKLSAVISGADLTEPFSNFTFIFLALSLSVRRFYGALVSVFSRLLGNSPVSWWFSCIFLGVLFDGLISEAAVMVLVCSAMAERFFSHGPSPRFCYLTLAAMLSVLSLGNLIFPFNITATLDLSQGWGWSHLTILQELSLRVLPVVILILVVVGAILRREINELGKDTVHTEEVPVWDRSLFGYLVAFFICGLMETTSFVLIATVAFIAVIERGKDRSSQPERLMLPLVLALFNYSMELHAYFLKSCVVSFYEGWGANYELATTALFSSMNEHIPGEAFVNAFSQKGTVGQGLALLTISLGSAVALFSNTVNVLASKLLRDYFPNRAVSNFGLLMYSIPIALISWVFLYLTYSIY